MTYDFDALTDRSGTYSLKWEEAGDALPMWVADTRSCPMSGRTPISAGGGTATA